MPREPIPLIRERGFLKAEKLFILSYEGEKTEVKYFITDSGIPNILMIQELLKLYH